MGNEKRVQKKKEKRVQTNLWLPKGTGQGEGWTGGLGLASAHGDVWNDWPTGTCCIVQGTLPNIL